MSIDLHDKLRAYRRASISEYLVWRTVEGRFDWFVLDGGDYRPNPSDATGVIRSRAFPGLWLNVTALLARNAAAVMDTLELGLKSPEHAAFAARLREAK